ncbi:uncharacterized protein LOC133114800 isoform X2 [Conger conger]|uniref:uncharacterized protein LOC133114800 isoform X2 n=1 Tax=Conger conger TaxID=82655 RepID=UPI002A5A73AE|nr:uncharacterized protein LOC133114800 isoform X2 [Conger conger]
MDVKTWYLAAVFCLAQCTGCTGLENKIFTSCEELRIEGGYKYSCEILDDLKTEEWNSSLVLAHTAKGADPQYYPEKVIKVSRASIILRECINVSYRSFDIFSKERWIHFIVTGNEERSDNVITGLENKIFTSCEELRIEGGYKYSCEILDDLKTEEWNSSLVLLAHTEKGADPQYHPDEVIKVSRASIILRECINVSYRSFNIFSKERWIHFIVAGNEERSDNVITVIAICVLLLLLFIMVVAICICKGKKCLTCPRRDSGDVEHHANAQNGYALAEMDSI